MFILSQKYSLPLKRLKCYCQRKQLWHIVREHKFMVKHYDHLYFCQYLGTYIHLSKIICLYVWVTSNHDNHDNH